MTDTSDLVLIEHFEDGVSRLTFNRPDRRNAMNQALRAAVIDALGECRGRSRAVILTGRGVAFCAGVDLKERAAREEDGTDGRPLPDNHRSVIERGTSWKAVQQEIISHPAVIIAAVNGIAVGGGSTLINSCDLAIAADDASIGMPEIGFGLYPGLAGPSTQFRIAHKRAAWMVFTAGRIDGRTAESWGMVNASVPRDRLQDEALELARSVARFDASALEWSKKAMWTMPALTTNWGDAFDYGLFINSQLRRNDAWASGIDIFKRGGHNPGQGRS